MTNTAIELAANAPAPPPPAPAKPPAILTRNLTKRYGSLTALDRLTLELEPGDVFGFIGPNGAGKSTTMKILAGLLEPTSGDAAVLGKRVAGNGDFVRRNIGYMPDFIGVYEDLLVSGTIDDLMARARAHPVIAVQVLDDPELAAGVLRADPRVDQVERRSSQLFVTLHDPSLHHHFLIERLVARNVRVHSVTPEQLKLEDVFLRLTKGIVQ